MTVLLSTPPAGATYLPWDPTAMQIEEPDTTYLMDMDVEQRLTNLNEGRMIEAYAFGTDLPPWMGGTKVAVVDGKYRPGMKCLSDTTYGYVALPSTGLVGADEFTIEMFVKADVAWSALSNQIAFRVFNDSRQYIQLLLNGGAVRADFRHNQALAGEVTKNPSIAHAAASGDWVSLALTLNAATMKLYIDGVLSITQADCTPPRFWADNWLSASGIAVAVGATHLTVSDLRISRLARVPGETPAP